MVARAAPAVRRERQIPTMPGNGADALESAGEWGTGRRAATGFPSSLRDVDVREIPRRNDKPEIRIDLARGGPAAVDREAQNLKSAPAGNQESFTLQGSPENRSVRKAGLASAADARC